MRTVQIAFHEFEEEDLIQAARVLMIDLYNATLKDDPLFHFLFERKGIIIRISSDECLSQVRNYLKSQGIAFDEYPYPNAPEGKYGVGPDSIDERHRDLILPVYHSNSVAALAMNSEDHLLYVERITHTAFNSMYGDSQLEGSLMVLLAAVKQGPLPLLISAFRDDFQGILDLLHKK